MFDVIIDIVVVVVAILVVLQTAVGNSDVLQYFARHVGRLVQARSGGVGRRNECFCYW